MPSTVRRDLWIIGVAAALVILWVLFAGGGFPLDDSWIHQTYGRNLAQYGEWAYTPGIPSTASTSPLYTVMLAVGHWFGLPVALWTHGLGILCLAVAGLAAARMAERLLPGEKRIGLYAGLAIVASWHLLWAAAAGMETIVFSMFTLVLIWVAWRELDHDRPGWVSAVKGAEPLVPHLMRGALFGIVAGLTTLARPEGALLVGLLGLALLIVRPGMSWHTLFVYGTSAVIAFIVVLAPYLIFNYQVTGGLLPNTAASKRADLMVLFLTPYPQRVIDLLVPLSAGPQLLLLTGTLMFVIAQVRALPTERKRWLLLVPLAWSLALVLLYAAYLPAYFQHGRYVIPALPTFIMCSVVGLALLARWGRRVMLRRVLARAIIISTVGMYAVMALWLGMTTYARDVEIIDSEMVRAAYWITDNIPSDELMAIHDIGAVGYFAPRTIIDLAGLASPEMLERNLIPVEQHGEAVYAYLRERNVRYIMGFVDQLPGANPDDPRLCPVFRARGDAAEVSAVNNMSVYRIAWDGVCS
ncbi:MAG: hypothetical protein SF123_21295 [Chloroflexota bacterium]|nr:hypothetical protein [Chloroflexota bacterium]